MSSKRLVRLVFEDGWTERDTVETPLRGYRSHVWAELEDGSRQRLTFYDITRLSQTLADEAAGGRPFLAERGLVVLAEVTRENMETAVQQLAAEGFFEET